VDPDYERVSELAGELWTSNMAQQHLDARLSALEAACSALCSQSPAAEIVVARFREILTTCDEANASRPNPDWQFQKHYLRRFMLMVENRAGAVDGRSAV
jgi:hypothetical protein